MSRRVFRHHRHAPLEPRMNVRMSSLDPKAPRAQSDCRTCNRRRIKCDRSIPTCKKCEVRELECPGYGIRLKWDQGIASRGKLTGLDSPAITYKNTNSQFRSPKSCPGRRSSSASQDDSSSHTESSSSLPDDFIDINDNSSLQSSECGLIPDDFAIDMALSWAAYPTILRDPRLTRLIHHYDQHLVGTLSWVDSQHNPWRNTVLPKAMENTVLMSSVLALASAHLSQRISAIGATSLSDMTMCSNFRTRSLESLAQYLQDERSVDDSSVVGTCKEDSDAMLATMIILYHVELVKPDSNMTRLHLQAARILLRHLLADSSRSGLSDVTYQFLRREVAIIDISSFISDFGDTVELPESYLIEHEGSLFDLYALVIRDITVAERRTHTAKTRGEKVPPIQMRWWEDRLDQAAERSHHICYQIGLLPEHHANDLDCLIDAYHSAGLIYASQALSDLSTVQESIHELSSHLIINLQHLSRRQNVVQNLAWPAFIAGTVCHGKRDEQGEIEKILREFMSRTGFFHVQQALEFLRAYWCLPHTNPTNWIEFARSYSGMHIISLVL